MTTPATEIAWPGGFEDFYYKVRLFKEKILNGTLVAIDPASKSAGFALFHNGVLQTSGTITLGKNLSIERRLRELYAKIQEITPVPIDVLTIELIRGRQAHWHLLWAVGVSIAAADAPIMIETPIRVWRSMAAITDGYVKSDAADATAIGQALVALAKRG